MGHTWEAGEGEKKAESPTSDLAALLSSDRAEIQSQAQAPPPTPHTSSEGLCHPAICLLVMQMYFFLKWRYEQYPPAWPLCGALH